MAEEKSISEVGISPGRDNSPCMEETSEDSEEETYGQMDEIADMLKVELNEETQREDFSEPEILPIWTEFASKQKVFKFTGKGGFQIKLEPTITPIDAFKLFVSDEVLDHLVEQTNLYARQEIVARNSENSDKPIQQYSRINLWKETGIDKKQMEMFLGINLWMGLNRRGSVDEYWSKSLLFENSLSNKIMARNQFELISNFLHFADNTNIEEGKCIGKVAPLIEILVKNYQSVFIPPKDVVIDETLIPWKGSLVYRQDAPEKSQIYGIKLYKLGTADGYTFNMHVHLGHQNSKISKRRVAELICEELVHNLLNEGRTLYIHNFYTSYQLALSLLKQKTHLVGLISTTEKNMPKNVAEAKLKKGEMRAKEEQNGIVYMKWKDSSDLRIISTKHKPQILEITAKKQKLEQLQGEETAISKMSPPPKRKRFCENPQKPAVVIAHNAGKNKVELSDQMASFAITLRQGAKWYRKLALELLLGVSMINAHFVYQQATKKRINIRQFRIKVAEALLNCEPSERCVLPDQKITHILQTQKNSANKTINRLCKLCYMRISSTIGRGEAKRKSSKSNYFCTGCFINGKNVYMCRPCFNDAHQGNFNST